MKLTPINNIKSKLYILCTTFVVMNISACAKPLQSVTEEVSQEKIIQEDVYQEEIQTLKEEMKALKEEMQVLKENIQTPKNEIQTLTDEPKISQTAINHTAKDTNGNDAATDIQTPQEETPIAKEQVLAMSSSNISGEVGQEILTIGNKMAVETKEIIKGSCWDYINTVYNRAGYPVHQRVTVYESNKDEGPYADTNTIQAGDWLYYINHSYHGIEHSGIFVNWVDESKKIANILSYGGEHRQEPGRYRDYDLSNVYTIIRAENKVQTP